MIPEISQDWFRNLLTFKRFLQGDKPLPGGNTSHPRGFHVVTIESGDKVFFTYQGTATSKDNALMDLKGNWSISGGSGKKKGIKGKGTFTCTPSGTTTSPAKSRASTDSRSSSDSGFPLGLQLG